MIHVDRSAVEAPNLSAPGSRLLPGDRNFNVDYARDLASDFFGRSQKLRKQETFVFKPLWASPAVLRALLALFNKKCAFCETPTIPTTVTLRTTEVPHFRPTSSAVSLDGRVAPDHYWWLAYEWSNLYLICAACNKAKASRFPVEGPRAKPRTDASTEKPVLLDPCRDDPAPELVFQPDGTVASDTTRGITTIDVFNLNRPELVAQRQTAYALVVRDLSSRGVAGVDLATLFPAYLDPALPFAGCQRQAVAVMSVDLAARGGVPLQQAPDVVQVGDNSSARQAQVKSGYDEYKDRQERYSLDRSEADRSFFVAARTIQRIEIRNFRAIKRLDIDMPSHEGAWLMLLGENGTGKSSVLQALALTLMGASYRNELTRRLRVNASRVVRRGTAAGSVRVWLDGLRSPIELKFRADSSRFEGSPPEAKTLIAAYGATRLLPRYGFKPRKTPRHADVDNLFNPFEPLANAEQWLMDAPPARFDAAAKALKLLLPIGPRDKLMRRQPSTRPGEVVARFSRTTLSLEELSDGFQSVIALATDAMKVLFDPWESMAVAEGVIVVDELGAHLHPRWKMQIVAALRTVFPRVQFIATTHDPLCLRGLRSGEVMVLERQRTAGVVGITDLPPVEGLRADQLLTSEHFGLSSTLDAETEQLFDEFYDLQAIHRPAATQVARLQELEGLLADRDLMGRDLRERAMLLAIDRYIAQIRDTGDEEQRAHLREAMLEEAKQLYATVPPEPLVTS